MFLFLPTLTDRNLSPRNSKFKYLFLELVAMNAVRIEITKLACGIAVDNVSSSSNILITFS